MMVQLVIFILGIMVGLVAYHLYAAAPPPLEDESFRTLHVAKDALYLRTVQLTHEAEGLAMGTSGAYKRWTFVLQKLGREFPDRAKEFGLVIEAALRG